MLTSPQLRPENLISVQILRAVTLFFLIVAFFWLMLLWVSVFVTPPGFYFRGSGFFPCSFAALALGLLIVGLLFFSEPSKVIRISFIAIAVILAIPLILILIVPQLRVEEGWLGLASVGWAVFISIWLAVTDELVRVFKDHQEERLLGQAEPDRRTAKEWGAVLMSTIIQIILGFVAVMLTASMCLRARDASLPVPGQKYYVDGDKYRIHLFCSANATYTNGTNVPTVLFEAGYDTFESTLYTVAENAVRNGSIARYCFADRPGIAFSENAPSPFSAGSAASVLSDALAQAGENGTWVLASTGVGSVYNRVLSARLGNRVKGLLLIEPLHEDLLHRIGSTDKSFFLWLQGILSPLGIESVPSAIFRGRTRQDRVFGRAAAEDGRFIKAKLQESLVANSLTKDEVIAARNIQNKGTPLVLISSGKNMEEDREWEKMQKDLTDLTGNLLSWDIVDKAPSEVWKTLEGRETIEKRLKMLVHGLTV